MTEKEQGDDQGAADTSSDASSSESTGDSFMDTYGNARLTTTEQRVDQRPHEDKMIRPDRTRHG